MSHAIRIATISIATIAAIGLMACSFFDTYKGDYSCAGISKITSYSQSQQTGRRSNDPVEKKAEFFLVFVNKDDVRVLLTADALRYSKKQTVFAGKSVYQNEDLSYTSKTSFLFDVEKKTLVVIKDSVSIIHGYDYHTMSEFEGTCQKE